MVQKSRVRDILRAVIKSTWILLGYEYRVAKEFDT